MYLTIRNVAELLHISKPTLYRWVKARQIPHVRRGHRILFNEKQIEEWMNVTSTYKEESFIDILNNNK